MYIQPYQRGYHGFPGVSWQVCFCYKWAAAWEITGNVQSAFVGREALFTWWSCARCRPERCLVTAVLSAFFASAWAMCSLPFLILFSFCGDTVFISDGKTTSKSCKSSVWIRSSTPVKCPMSSISRIFMMDIYFLMSAWAAEMWKTNPSVFLWFHVIEKQEAKAVFAHLCQLGSFSLLIAPGSAITG